MPVIFYSDDCIAHDMGQGHPEQPARIEVIRQYLENSPLASDLSWCEPALASRDDLYLAHSKDYVDYIFENAPVEGMYYLDPDTSMNSGSLNATLRASGAALAAISHVAAKPEPVVCLTRPPGHHAEADRAIQSSL